MRNYLVIDPGKTSGWAYFVDGHPQSFGQVEGEDKFLAWLASDALHWNLDFVLVENFRIRPGHNFSWGTMLPIQLIGAVKYWAYLAEIPIKLQEPSVKGLVNKKLFGGVTKSNSMNHAMDAVAHGVYWWGKHGEDGPQAST